MASILRRFFSSLISAAIGIAVSPTGADAATAPVHGVVVAQSDRAHVLVRLDAITETQAAGTKRYRIDPAQAMSPGQRIDALLTDGVLSDVTPSEGYTAGIPDSREITTLNVGDTLPAIHLVDQNGRMYDLSNAWLGKTVVVSFVFTRCPDALICPAISGKFAYLQEHLDQARTHLVEITIDPRYDSPKVLSAYAKRFGAVAENWSIMTGEQNQIGLLINRFGLSNLENQPGNFVHDDTLAIVKPDGKIAELISTVGWAPDDVIASVLHDQGNESNPFRRFELATIAGVVSLCGGSTTTGQVVLDSSVFVLGVLFFGGLLYKFGRRIWSRES